MVVNELNIRGDLDRYTTGVRAWAEALGPWDYNMAIVGQQGSAAGAVIQAWGYYLELGYSIDRRTSPRLYAHYNFGSGDEDPEDGRIGGFVDLYPTAHRWYGYNDLVGWRNIKNLRLGAEVKPHAKLGLQFDYHSFWLVSRHDALYNVGGRLSVAPPPEGAADTKIGDEVNVTFTLPLTELISLGGGVGYLFPGPFLKANSPGVGNTFLVFGDRLQFLIESEASVGRGRYSEAFTCGNFVCIVARAFRRWTDRLECLTARWADVSLRRNGLWNWLQSA